MYKDIISVVKPTVEAMGYDCWGVQLNAYSRRALLRVFIDHDNGITVDDCSLVSQQLSGVLDVEDPIHQPYVLEVSSPGLDRLLLEVEHYQRYVGKKVRLRLYRAVCGRRRLAGVLNAVGENEIDLLVDGENIRVALDTIQRANLVYEYGANKKEKK